MSKNIVQFNEEIIKGQIKELVRGSVEETLNELLEAEAQKLTQAARYERSEARQGYRSGHYDRNLTTTSGDVTLHVPRLKGISFETAIIERYRRRESSVEEALIEMYLAGVSVRRVEDITEALWGSKVSASTISELNKKAYVNIEAWRNRPLQGGKYPYVYVDGIYLKRNWGGEYENVAVLVAGKGKRPADCGEPCRRRGAFRRPSAGGIHPPRSAAQLQGRMICHTFFICASKSFPQAPFLVS